MDLRAYSIQAAEAPAPAVHAEDDVDDVVELTPEAVLQKVEVQAGTTTDVAASSKGSCLSPLVVGDEEAGKVVAVAVADGGSAVRDLTCPECGKTFLSDKAMYGHLRSHPEKGYKGATRPSAPASPAAVAGHKKPRNEAESLPAMNMSAAAATAGEKELSMKWPVTAKRGRASSTPSAGSAPAAVVQSSSCSSGEEAAMILWEMASSGATSEIQQSLQPVHVRDAKNQFPDVVQPMLLDHVAQNQMPELMQLMPLDHVDCSVTDQTPDAEPQIVQPELAPEVITESQTPNVKELRLEIPTKNVVVVVHDKSAPTNQQPVAPGRGAEKLKKRRHLDPEQSLRSASPESANVQPPAKRIPSPASDRKHKCPTCSTLFPTYQALGGHMAGHSKGNSKYGARHDYPAALQTMQSFLAHRKQSSNAIIGGTGAAEGAVPGVGREGAVAGAGQVGAVVGTGHVGAVTCVGHEGALAAAGQERHGVLPPAPMAQSAEPHVCPVCNVTFGSGQALGGHRRKHWFSEKQQARAPASAPRNFDLNELPSDAEGENQPELSGAGNHRSLGP